MFGDFSGESILSVFTDKMGGNLDVLKEELRKLGPSKLKKTCESIGADLGEDKASTITNILKKIGEGDMGKKKAKEKKKKAPEVEAKVQETPTEQVVEAPAEPPTEAAVEAPALSTEAVELKIDKEWLKSVPRMSAADKARTTASIKASGLLNPIEVVQREDGLYIFDGHSRYEIMKELELPVTMDDIKIIECPEDPLYGIYVANIARRQLTDIDKIKLAKKHYPQIIKKVEEAKKEARKEAGAKVKATAEAKKKAKAAGVKDEDLPAFLKTSVPPAQQKGGKKPKKEEVHTREALAKATGVSPAMIKFDQWLSKYAKKFYDECVKEAKDLNQEPEIGAIYKRAKEMWDVVKKTDPEMFEKVKSGDVELAEAAEECWDKIPPEVRKSGPVEMAYMNAKAVYMKVLEKKYNGEITPDEFETDYVARLDVLIQDAVTKKQ